MSKRIVFILGAGASYSAGVPLLSDFIEQGQLIFDEMLTNDPDYKYFENVLQTLSSIPNQLRWLRTEAIDIETLLGACEGAKHCNWFLGSAYPTNLEECICRFMSRTIHQTGKLQKPIGSAPVSPTNLVLPHDSYLQFGSVLKDIWAKGSDTEISFISFNYDLLLDYLLYYDGVEVSYGSGGLGNFMGQTGSPTNPVRNPNAKVKIYKPHGSLNWRHCGCPRGPMQALSAVDLIYSLKKDEYRIGRRHLAPCPACGNEPLPVIAPPISTKSLIIRQIPEVWKEAARTLVNATHLVAIGYSMAASDNMMTLMRVIGGTGTTHRIRTPFLAVDPSFEDVQPGELKPIKKTLPKSLSSVDAKYQAVLGPGYTEKGYFFRCGFEDVRTHDAIIDFVSRHG